MTKNHSNPRKIKKRDLGQKITTDALKRDKIEKEILNNHRNNKKKYNENLLSNKLNNSHLLRKQNK